MSNPYMVKIPFCNTGNKNAIQLTQQAGQDPEDATYQEGFPPVTMLNEDAGGLPPKGLDFNGIFYELSSPIAHYCRGDRIQFDATYAVAIGGYAKGWVVASNDYQKDYISLVDNNLADPNGTNTTWAVYAGQGSVPTATSTTTGTVKLVNSLASTATDAALTAAQGKALNDDKANKTTTLTAGNGLSGGGTLEINRTLTLGTPSKITGSTTNSVTATSHTHEIDNASTSVAGVVKLNNTLTSTSTTEALTAAQGKALNDKMLGVDQTWVDVTSSRNLESTYSNGTGKPIQVAITIAGQNNFSPSVLFVNNLEIVRVSNSSQYGQDKNICIVIPSGSTYRLSGSAFSRWTELR